MHHVAIVVVPSPEGTPPRVQTYLAAWLVSAMSVESPAERLRQLGEDRL